jgi:gamma-glutamylcyclotransferase (GGCT)/AIG2-like uncharacterized protein YtfP
MNTIFVYGTLKRGFRNHLLLHDSEYLGEATTAERYTMTVADGIPFVNRNEQLSHIHGEVYSVTKNTFDKLDELEEHPVRYKREEVEIHLHQEKGRPLPLTAWIYLKSQKGTVISTGTFTKMEECLERR